MRHRRQLAAIKGDNTLVALHVGALIDGHREMPLAQEGARSGSRPKRAHPVSMEAGIATHVSRTGEIGHQHVDGSVGARLQDELAVKLERGAKHRGKGHCLPQQQ